MKKLFLLLLLSGCTTVTTPVTKTTTKAQVEAVPMPKDVAPLARALVAPSAVAVPVVYVSFEYRWPTFAPVVFEVWHSTTILPAVNWSKAIETNYTGSFSYRIPFSATNDMELFKVRARDPNTGLVSDWATIK